MTSENYRIIAGNVEAKESVTIGPFTQVGVSYRMVGGEKPESRSQTELQENVEVRSHVVICKGTSIEAGSVIEDYCKIEQDVDIGMDSFVIYRSQICNDATIGDSCVIAGFVGERSTVEDGCRVFGSLIHRQDDPTAGWDDAVEPAPVLGSNVFVGWDATVIGGVSIGENTYVAAGATVTRNVPPNKIVVGENNVISPDQWDGQLADSGYFTNE